MYRFRYEMAELIVRLAQWIKPSNYGLEIERAAVFTVLEGIGMQAEEAGIKDYGEVTLFDMMVYWKQGHQNDQDCGHSAG
jgi:hypothetical protein